jgi:L-cystine transport system substrate-binding protein
MVKRYLGRAFVLVMAVFAANVFTSCQKKAPSTAEGAVQELIIGVGEAEPRYSLLNDQEELEGLEIDMLKALDEMLPEYSFKLQPMEFAQILLSLEGGRIDVAVHQLEFNPERAKKYLYADEGYLTNPLYIAVLESNNTIQSFDDLRGKTLAFTDTASNNFYICDTWNKANGGEINIVLEPDITITLDNMKKGLVDAICSQPRTVDRLEENFGVPLKITGKPVSDSPNYFVFAQNGGDIKNVFDKTLAAYKKDEKLRELSIKWLGADYTPESE